jgi:MFS superfamily sulfate permease-like transporter
MGGNMQFIAPADVRIYMSTFASTYIRTSDFHSVTVESRDRSTPFKQRKEWSTCDNPFTLGDVVRRIRNEHLGQIIVYHLRKPIFFGQASSFPMNA